VRLLDTRACFDDSRVIYTVWGCLLFLLINVEVASFFYQYLEAARLMSISVLWALFSVVLMGLGLRFNITGMRKTVMVLFLVTTAKVLVFDGYRTLHLFD